MIATLFLVSVGLFVLAYFVYGRFLERRLDVRGDRATPAHTLEDGMDYVPTSTPILFGHHFSSIAGAGPIVGPVIAAAAFGWLPALLWIVVGAIFVGGVHDLSSLIASIRHQGRSVGQMCRELLSPLAYRLFLLFIWLTMIYIEIVFLDLTASTFAPPISGAAGKSAAQQILHGGTVATASLLYIVLALLFGLAIYHLRLKIWLGTIIFVPLVFLSLWAGQVLPLSADHMPLLFGSAKNTWAAILLGYCFMASILPVWLLLQPRDYLSSFLLYACLACGALGLVVSGWGGHVTIAYPAFITWHDAQLKFLFPALFVTIACGAVSGFHAIVASGTTAKQLRDERSARPVAYGAMLVEGVLALLALSAVMVLTRRPTDTPVAVFASGLGGFLAPLGVSHGLATTFGMLAVSTFLLTTLDTCTRLGRFIFEELFQLRGPAARIVGTLATLLVPAFVVFRQIPGPGGELMPAWQAIWPAFGATNQLLAALALLVVYAWLRRERKRAVFVLVPLVFMCVTTLTALGQLVMSNLFGGGSVLIGGLSLVLVILALVLIGNTCWSLRGARSPEVT